MIVKSFLEHYLQLFIVLRIKKDNQECRNCSWLIWSWYLFIIICYSISRAIARAVLFSELLLKLHQKHDINRMHDIIQKLLNVFLLLFLQEFFECNWYRIPNKIPKQHTKTKYHTKKTNTFTRLSWNCTWIKFSVFMMLCVILDVRIKFTYSNFISIQKKLLNVEIKHKITIKISFNVYI